MEEFTEANDVSILNTGAPTRVAYDTETCSDLSIVTPILAPSLDWTVPASPYESDHVSIVKKLLNVRSEGSQVENKNVKKADWVKYRGSKDEQCRME